MISFTFKHLLRIILSSTRHWFDILFWQFEQINKQVVTDTTFFFFFQLHTSPHYFSLGAGCIDLGVWSVPEVCDVGAWVRNMTAAAMAAEPHHADDDDCVLNLYAHKCQ